jgi:lactoylglutathione lyase
MITGLAHIAITVKDMEKSLDFYTRVLGFKKAFELPEPKTGAPWIVYLHLAGRQFVELFYNGTKDNPWEPALRGFNHLCLEVDDMQATMKHIEASGYKIDRPAKEGPDFNWQSWLTDPDGIRIELMQISPKSPQGKLIEGK